MFSQIYLGGIPPTITGDSAFLSFISTLCGIEALGSHRYPEISENGARFTKFISTHLPDAYGALAGDLWQFRNGIVHAFNPGRFALVHHQSHRHLQNEAGGRKVLNAEDFYAALLYAAQKFFQEIETSEDMQERFAGVLSREGGVANLMPIR